MKLSTLINAGNLIMTGKVISGKWQWSIIIRRLCVISLLVIIAFLAANILWALLPSPDSRLVGPSTGNDPTQVEAANTAPSISMQQLAKLTVFGISEDGNSGNNINLDQAKSSRLSLTLNGVLPSNNAAMSKAIISHNNSQASYSPGDELPISNRVTLSQVLTDRVIINNRGKYETLWLNNEAIDANKHIYRARSTKPTISSGARRAADGPYRGIYSPKFLSTLFRRHPALSSLMSSRSLRLDSL
jgi:general secretion pathway protein C